MSCGAGDSIIFALSAITFWHQQYAWALDWRAPTGIWRQSHCYRTCDLYSINPIPTVGPSCYGFPTGNVTLLDRPLSVLSGGGSFYQFYTEDFKYQLPNYRQLLVNHSSSGLRFYQLNPEHGTGDAQMEILSSANVSIFSLKSERNFVVLDPSSSIVYFDLCMISC